MRRGEQMRHFHGIDSLRDNEKPRRELARRQVRRAVIALKRSLILAGCAAGCALLIGCGPSPTCQVAGRWTSGADCMPATMESSCRAVHEAHEPYRYGVNDGCWPQAMTDLCERSVALADSPDQIAAARDLCGMTPGTTWNR